MASDACCQKCRGTGQEQYYHDDNACAPHNWYSRRCPDCHGSGIDSAKRVVVLETTLRVVVDAFAGVDLWNALDGQFEGIEVAVEEAREALGETDGE